MLYQSLQYSSIIAGLFMLSRHEGATYSVSGSHTCSSTTCIFNCNAEGKSAPNGETVTCSGGTACVFNCDAKACFKESTIDARNAASLEITVVGNECLKQATILTPNGGQAIINIANGGEKGLSSAVITGGTGGQIFIDCTETLGGGKEQYGECEALRVNAQNAQFLHINVGRDSSMAGAFEVYCPRGSDYSGSYAAPCIIDISQGGVIQGVIDAYYGTPRDVVIAYGGTYSGSTLRCYGTSSVGIPVGASSVCYNTKPPTKFPTASPTTRSPTKLPSKNPTKQPSPAPTKTPTKVPTKVPTAAPNFDPTVSPTADPTGGPTPIPTPAPTDIVTDAPTPRPTDDDDDDDDQGDEDSNSQLVNDNSNVVDAGGADTRGFGGLSSMEFIAVLCTVFVILGCCLVGVVVMFCMRKMSKSDEEELSSEQILKPPLAKVVDAEESSDDTDDGVDTVPVAAAAAQAVGPLGPGSPMYAAVGDEKSSRASSVMTGLSMPRQHPQAVSVVRPPPQPQSPANQSVYSQQPQRPDANLEMRKIQAMQQMQAQMQMQKMLAMRMQMQMQMQMQQQNMMPSNFQYFDPLGQMSNFQHHAGEPNAGGGAAMMNIEMPPQPQIGGDGGAGAQLQYKESLLVQPVIQLSARKEGGNTFGRDFGDDDEWDEEQQDAMLSSPDGSLMLGQGDQQQYRTKGGKYNHAQYIKYNGEPQYDN